MSKRTWNKKYTKKKSSSQIIDEKIAFLDREMRKTKLGESIVNSATSVYTITGYDNGEPAVPPVPAVPPTYENVTGGLSNANDFVWPNQGDGSNPNAAPVIPSNLYTTYNGQQIPALRQIEGDYGNNIPLGYVIGHSILSTYPVGYLSANGINIIASAGVYGRYDTELGRKYADAFYRWPYPGKIDKTIYFWQPLDCFLGDCRGAGQYYPSNLSNTSTPKATYALYGYTLWLPADAQGNPLPNQIMTDPGDPEIPGIPAVPPKPVVLSRNSLGDPNYFPGFIKAGIDFIKNIGNALSEFGKGAEDAINKIGDNLRGIETNVSNIVNGMQDGFNLLNKVKDVLGSSQSQWGPKDSDGRYTLPAGAVGTQSNPVVNKVSSSTQEYLMSGYDPKIDGSLGTYLQRKTSLGIEQGGNVGAKGTHNNITGTPYIAPNGDIHIPDTYGFGSSQDVYNKPVVKQTVDVISTIAGALGGENARKQASENVQTFFDQSLFAIIPGTPGREAPIVHFETVIPASQVQKLSPNYRNQPVKEETLFEKFKRQNKINQKKNKSNEFDLLIQAIQNLPGPIKKYLLLEFETSIKLATLPPDQRTFNEKEIRNELLVKTSELYVDTHFPENQKLFKKLQQSIKRNIKLTDPKTFKNVVDTLSFKKLLSVDYVNEVGAPKKKPKLQNRNKKTAARFLKRPRIKSAMELIDEKIIQLEKDLKKTGMTP